MRFEGVPIGLPESNFHRVRPVQRMSFEGFASIARLILQSVSLAFLGRLFFSRHGRGGVGAAESGREVRLDRFGGLGTAVLVHLCQSVFVWDGI